MAFDDEFVIAVRQYILDTLSPLIPTAGDSGGKFVYSLLKRALKSASREDLEQVVLHCVAFTDGLRERGFITEELARQAAEYLNPGVIHDAISEPHYDTLGGGDDSTNRAALSGQSALDRPDEEWQEHTGEAPLDELSEGHEEGDEEGMESPSDTGDRHQAEVEGDDDPDGEVDTEALSEDGTG